MQNIKVKEYDAVIVGSGAAGYSAACRIKEDGRKSVCVVTEGVLCGTSRNTGSDKQTYYKLGLSGDTPDSVRSMAQTLFSGGCVDGDNALCEAALSVRCFFNLCEAGVPFPCNRYGEYVGYKTDHDPFARATSVGPLTSKYMTEALENKAAALGTDVYDRILTVEILVSNKKVCGLLGYDLNNNEYIAFRCHNVILATGGPSGIYSDSVYPTSHNGFSSLALEAGASLQNMTEWQYGLASVNPKWNVSGTYMQVLPRFVSIDSNGNEYEFLSEFFEDKYEAMSVVFLKGYQWPFDINKVRNGSSVIDLLVYRENILRGRTVYLDFTKNPFDLEEIEFEKLDREVYEYLENANALFGTPIQRLEKMNMPAISLYREKGVDITESYLEIAVCSQHNNGGVSVNKWWETEVSGLFAIGECAGTHGVARPGGSALNAGQVGALRASQYICESKSENICENAFKRSLDASVSKNRSFIENAFNNEANAKSELLHIRKAMSACAGAIRNTENMEKHKCYLQSKLAAFKSEIGISELKDVEWLYRLKDTMIVQQAVLTAMTDYFDRVKVSRGSALYTDTKGELRTGLEEIFRFSLTEEKNEGKIQQLSLVDGNIKTEWRYSRPIPEDDGFFENVWQKYRENKNVY